MKPLQYVRNRMKNSYYISFEIKLWRDNIIIRKKFRQSQMNKLLEYLIENGRVEIGR